MVVAKWLGRKSASKLTPSASRRRSTLRKRLQLQPLESRRLLAVGTSSGDVLVDEAWCEDTVITGPLRIAPGVTVTVDPDVIVTIEEGASINVEGTLDINAAQAIRIEDGSRFSLGGTNLITVRSGGALTANDTRLERVGDNTDLSALIVESGGSISIVDSVVTLDQVFLDDGSVIASGGMTGNEFFSPVFTPISHLDETNVNLRTNDRFGDIEILSGQSIDDGQTLNLNPLGTGSTESIRFRLNNLTVSSGGTLNILPASRVVIEEAAVISVDGIMTVNDAESISIVDGSRFENGSLNAIQIRDGGELTANDTPFLRIGDNTDRSSLIVNAGATISLVDNVFDLDDVFFADGSLIGSSGVIDNQFNNPIFTPANHLFDGVANLKLNDRFEDVEIIAGQVIADSETLVLGPLGTQNVGEMRYRVNSLEIRPGGQLDIIADSKVVLEEAATLLVDGELNILNAESFSIIDGSRFENGSVNSIQVRDGGKLLAVGSLFNRIGDNTDRASLLVDSGATVGLVDNVFDLDEVFFADGSLIGSSGVIDNQFHNPIFTPANHLFDGVANLKSNDRFEDVEIIGGQAIASGETLVLEPLGSQNTGEMRYRVNSFDIRPGGQLDIVADTKVLLEEAATLLVDGELNILNAESFSIIDGSRFENGSVNSIQVRDGGKMLAVGTLFDRVGDNTDRASLLVDSGATVGLVDNVFDLDDVFFADGSIIGSSGVVDNQFGNPVFTPVGHLLDSNMNIKSNDSFEDVHLLPEQAVLSGSTLHLNLLGPTQSDAMRYVLNDLVINAGGRLNIGQDVEVLLQEGGVIDVDGRMEINGAESFSIQEGSQFSLESLNAIRVRNGGLFSATATRFEQLGDGGDRTALISDPGSVVSISDSFYGLEDLSLGGDSATILRNDIDAIVTVDGGTLFDFYLNDLSDLPNENTGLVAVGDSAATLDFRRNYWGTTVASEIEGLILDQNDDLGRPDIVFDPFLLQPNPVPEYASVGLTVDSSLLIAGGIADVTYNVRNFSGAGNASATSVVAFFLSANDSASQSILLGFDNVAALAAGEETGTRSVPLSLPNASATIWSTGLPANYSIRMLVDATDAIAEFDETNNWDSTGITVSPTIATVTQTQQSTTVSEDGDQDTFNVQLSLPPQSNVTVRATPDGQLDLGSGPGVAVDLVFGPADVNTPIEVSISAIDDLEIEGPTIRQVEFQISSADQRFDGIELPPLSVQILDNDTVQVTEVEINGGDTQRSSIDEIRVTFNTVVEISSTAIKLQNLDTGMALNTTVASSEVIGGKTVATIGYDATLLTNGNYEVVLRGSGVSASGIPLDGDSDGTAGGDYVDEFFRFFGDSDGDRDVDGQDYGRFGRTFLRSAGEPEYDAKFDWDKDGDVDGRDYGQFGLNFLKTLDSVS